MPALWSLQANGPTLLQLKDRKKERVDNYRHGGAPGAEVGGGGALTRSPSTSPHVRPAPSPTAIQLGGGDHLCRGEAGTAGRGTGPTLL
jgi:hypothetical protein